MDTLQRIDVFERVLSRQLDWIRATDTRGAFVVALATALLATLGTLVSWTGKPLNVSQFVVAGPAALPELVALAYVWMAAFPQTFGPRHSMIFFGGIKKYERDAYVSAVQDVEAGEYLKDLAKQCHRNGEIANDKYKLIKSALMWLYISVVTWIIAAIVLFTMSVTPAS